MKLSILIPSLESRKESLINIVTVLGNQRNKLGLTSADVEILTLVDNGHMSIGEKRNALVQGASGKYVCFIDDDDDISHYYLEEILKGIELDVDCCSLRGVITRDGLNPELFEHSIAYNKYITTDNSIKYERYPNHLNAIKSDIAKRFAFLEINHGEDTEWATQINKSGLLKDEYYIDKVLYHYQFKPNK